MTGNGHASVFQSLSKGSGGIAIAILAVLLAFVVVKNSLYVVSPDNFHEELRILYHLDPERTHSDDYAGQFLAKAPQPFLYLFLTKTAVGSGVDLSAFHKFLGIFCYLLLLAGSAVAGWRVGGALAALATTAFVAAQPLYLYQAASATPHAFAFPLLGWGLVCLLYGRPYLLAGLTILSGLLYPPVSPILGLVLAWYFVVDRKGLNRRNANRTVDVVLIGITGLISLALLLNQLTPIDGYGAALAPGVDTELYPENGPDGRHFQGVFHPLNYVFTVATGQLHDALPPLVALMLPIGVAAVAGLGLYYTRHNSSLLRSLLAFIVPSAAFCILVTLLRPYVAYRFLLYPLFTVLPILFVYGLFTLCYTYRSALRYPTAVAATIVAAVILSLSITSGYYVFSIIELDESSTKLMERMKRSPPGTLVAAWPGGAQTSLIPYVAGRPMLVDYKAHYPTYEGHIANMRARMYDLIDAYLAKDLKPLINLRCRWQADYLIVDSTRLSGAAHSLKYFSPFDERVEKILATTKPQDLILRNPPADAITFQAGRFFMLDLSLISDGTRCADRDL